MRSLLKRRFRRVRGPAGFTLVELLVVIAILGILAVIAVPRVLSAIDETKSRKGRADMAVIQDAIDRFYQEHSVYPAKLGDLKTAGYLRPEVNFKNGYGKHYFYAVRYEADTGDKAAYNLKEYVLADPGQYPGTSWSDVTTDPIPEGKDPAATSWFFYFLSGSAPTGNISVATQNPSGGSGPVATTLTTQAPTVVKTAGGRPNRGDALYSGSARGVSFQDADATAGLDGRDFTVMWRPYTGGGFAKYWIFIAATPANLTLTQFTNGTSYRGEVTSQTTGSVTLASGVITDSQGNSLNATVKYKVYVVVLNSANTVLDVGESDVTAVAAP